MTSGGSAGYLVDTNVPLYAYDPADAAKRARATAVLQRLGVLRTGALSVQVLGEFYWNATRKLRPPVPHAQAERSVTRYARSWTVYDLTPLVVLEAVRGVQRHRFPYWDALIWATAKLNGVPTVLSEDFPAGSLIEGVRFVNPFAAGFDPAGL